MSLPDLPPWRQLLQVLAWPNNLATLARMVIVAGLVLPMFAGHRWQAEAASLVFMAGFWALDHLDGWLARRLGLCSSFGESLDLLADRFCDLLICAFLLQAAPDHSLAIVVFLLARIAPDALVCRFVGMADGIFTAALRDASASRTWLSKRVHNLLIEANSLAKALFFCAALFWSAPVWTGLVLILPALAFCVLALEVMRAHAAQVARRRDESGP